MIESILASIISAAVIGIAGWYLRARFSKAQYLPLPAKMDSANDYKGIEGDWFLYHYTGDRKLSKKAVLVCSKIELRLVSGLIVEGTEIVQADHRQSLEYALRGEIRAGQFYFTCICKQDPSEVYAGMFPNLLDKEATGAIVAKDYERELYASPAMLSKSEQSPEDVADHFRLARIKLLSPPAKKRERKGKIEEKPI